MSEEQNAGAQEEIQTYEPPQEFVEQANVNDPSVYEKAEEDFEEFWASWARELHWFKDWDQTLKWEPPFAEWFVGGKTNVAYNCLDYQIEQGRGDKDALVWIGDEPGTQKIYTYNELLAEVSKFANVLKDFGIQKGDGVAIYLSMIPELPIAMLACARIGAPHSVVFSAFQPGQLTERINDIEARVLVTADNPPRGGRKSPLKENADEALEDAPSIENVVVVRRTGDEVPMQEGRDHYWDEVVDNASDECPAEELDAEDMLYVLYSSGSTGKPKGIEHHVGGYMTQLLANMRWVMDIKEDDVFWCTADIGWVTGHSYIVYGPLLAGTTTVQYEGTPTYPENDRLWQIVEDLKVTHFYTAPTAIRALRKMGSEPIDKHDLSSLRLLGSVGEPINPDAWIWYYENVGKERCPIVDTWWQTETGGIMISGLPGITTMKPGAASHPFPGIFPGLWDEETEEFIEGAGSGALTINKPWPSMLRTLYKSPDRYKEEYFSAISDEIYYVEDGAKRDEDGYYTITGRIDDVLNVAGHRLSTVEIENALVSHEGVVEAAVIGRDDEDRGQAPVAFVILHSDEEDKYDEEYEKDLINTVAQKAGKISRPDRVFAVEDLPKTNSGKIMRRLLQNISQNEDLGDTSTLADPSVAETIQGQTQEQMS